MSIRFQWLAMTLVTALGVGCDNSSRVADGGISGTGVVGTGVSMGPVEAFGSVRLNDTTLAVTPATEILLAGQPATESDLRIGQVIRVEADFDAATAQRIEYFELLRGPLEAISIINPETLLARLTVMGQTVTTVAATRFEGVAGVDGLQLGDILEISGARDAQSSIVASFIRRAATGEYRLTGPIANLAGTTFDMAGLQIEFGSADTSALPGGMPRAGSVVRVIASPAGYTASPPRLVATRIEPALLLRPSTDDSVEVEGFVTRFAGLGDIDVDGQPVDASAAQIVGGTADNLTLDARVEVEGVIDAAGVLDAARVIIKPDEFVRIDAMLESVDAQNALLTLLTLSIEVPPEVRIEDKRSGGGGQLALGDLTAGMRLELRGFRDGTRLKATRIEVEDPQSRVILMAGVDAHDGTGMLTLLGLDVTASTAVGTQFEDEADDPISQAAFYAALMQGRLVKVRWDPFVTTATPVDQASLERQ